MKPLTIIVEGKTEEDFVKVVLGPHLLRAGIEAKPILIGTGTRKKGGGDVHLNILISDLGDALDGGGAATSLVDFYGFRDREGRTAEELESFVLQEVLNEYDESTPVRPYVQMHEFEGLLFSDPEAFHAIRMNEARANIESLRLIRREFDTPEDINDGRDRAPSRRLMREVRWYSKTIDGIAVAKETGIRRIREECRDFANGWNGWKGLPRNKPSNEKWR